MTRYWVSFWVPAGWLKEFEYHGPWWISGERDGEDDRTEHSICAAIEADSDCEAEALFEMSFDGLMWRDIEFRFVQEEPEDWEPFGGRFPRADWMVWPITVEQACQLRS